MPFVENEINFPLKQKKMNYDSGFDSKVDKNPCF